MNTIESVKAILVDVGASWVLFVLLATLAIAIAVYVERLVVYRSRTDDVRDLLASLDAALSRKDHAAALDSLAARRSVAADVARAGLRLASRGKDSATFGMESAIAAIRKSLESRLTVLATIGTNAPFLGLFGTVIGIVVAFDSLGRASTSTSAAATVMNAIAEALVATAVGLAVALPAVVMHNHLQRRANALLDDAETVSRLVLAYLVAETEG